MLFNNIRIADLNLRLIYAGFQTPLPSKDFTVFSLLTGLCDPGRGGIIPQGRLYSLGSFNNEQCPRNEFIVSQSMQTMCPLTHDNPNYCPFSLTSSSPLTDLSHSNSMITRKRNTLKIIIR